MELETARRVSMYLSTRWAWSPGREVLSCMLMDPNGTDRELLTCSGSLCIDATLWPWALYIVVMTEWIAVNIWAVDLENEPTTER